MIGGRTDEEDVKARGLGANRVAVDPFADLCYVFGGVVIYGL